MQIKEGMNAPAFALKDADGNLHKLSDYKGKKIILYFYPKDDTPGCTKQACDFRDNFPEFGKKNIIILGISPDDEKSHEKFIKKYSIPYTLLCDDNHAVADSYGVWGEKAFMGRKYMGIIRSTFLIDGKGVVKKSFYKVSPEGHWKMVLEEGY